MGGGRECEKKQEEKLKNWENEQESESKMKKNVETRGIQYTIWVSFLQNAEITSVSDFGVFSYA